ncbi:MAG: NRDE family protein [Pseudomonadales bacterium]|nr:NRDE family protein [Pseudomonadales bacterium]
MCLIVLAYQTSREYPLIVAANRDEFYQRASAPISFWGNKGEMLAGQDLTRGGVWLGITRNGRFAAVTNIREGLLKKRFPVSRGDLAKDYLQGDLSPAQYVKTLQPGRQYGGFHLLLGDLNELFHYSNRTERLNPIKPGIHGVSNHLFDETWPKTKSSQQGLKELVEQNKVSHQTLQHVMAQQPVKAEANSGKTANSNLDHIKHNPFLWSQDYGTCASSSLIVTRKDPAQTVATMDETRYRALGIETGNRRYSFGVNS